MTMGVFYARQGRKRSLSPFIPVAWWLRHLYRVHEIQILDPLSKKGFKIYISLFPAKYINTHTMGWALLRVPSSASLEADPS